VNVNTARFDFSGQRVLVTGASSGIGWEVTQQLLSAGARVYAMGRDAAALDTLAGQGCEVLRVDMVDQAQLASVLAELPVMHGLVNCAGISILEAATEVSASAFDQVMTVNVRAAAMVAASVAKAMIGEGVKGSIVNVSSQASLVALDDHLSY
jgi:NAD(P)-dependent dehydrogenase (short-subunit alcohol dehydrogenase family)